MDDKYYLFQRRNNSFKSLLVLSSYSHTRGNPETPEKTNEYKVDHWLKWQSRIMFLIMLMIAHPNPYSTLPQIHMSTDWGETEGSGVVVGFLFPVYHLPGHGRVVIVNCYCLIHMQTLESIQTIDCFTIGGLRMTIRIKCDNATHILNL